MLSTPVSSDTSIPEKDFTLADKPLSAIILSNIFVVCSSGSFRLPIIIMLAPFLANFLAIDWPIPVPLPVIKATLLHRLKDDRSACFPMAYEDFVHY